ncbi:MAG: hypothetical protein M1503_11555 [Thaumarchaeota archaeon]|nr:hypothetical protein [Nitrososphaerota archaeon]MCL5318879.1 hypothetical protein [Nitrososphaerota archaeon]
MFYIKLEDTDGQEVQEILNKLAKSKTLTRNSHILTFKLEIITPKDLEEQQDLFKPKGDPDYVA